MRADSPGTRISSNFAKPSHFATTPDSVDAEGPAAKKSRMSPANETSATDLGFPRGDQVAPHAHPLPLAEARALPPHAPPQEAFSAPDGPRALIDTCQQMLASERVQLDEALRVAEPTGEGYPALQIAHKLNHQLGSYFKALWPAEFEPKHNENAALELEAWRKSADEALQSLQSKMRAMNAQASELAKAAGTGNAPPDALSKSALLHRYVDMALEPTRKAFDTFKIAMTQRLRAP